MKKLRKFNEEGVISFEVLLSEFITAKEIDQSKLEALLYDSALSLELDEDMTLPDTIGTKKYDVAKLISESLNLKKNTYLYYDTGLWTWLAGFMLPDLAPLKKGSNERDFRERALYLLESSNWKKYYRHLLSFPCLIYTELGEKGRIFLRGKIHERGEIVEQLGSVNDIQRNPNIVEAATMLYYDKAKDDIYKGVASKNQPGTARRFRDVIQQLKLTFDLNAMNGSQIVGIMPLEFRNWQRVSK